MENFNNKTVTKTIRLEPETVKAIEQMAKESQRDFTKQVKFMLSEYIKMKERR